MNRAFPQVEMEPVYGFCHYLITVFADACFRGEYHGMEHLPRDTAFLIAANHASFMDPPFIGCRVPRQIAFFARKTLWKPGFPAWWLDTVGTIPVDRDGGQDVSAIKRVLKALKDGKALILFPEGTRSPDGQLQSAKAGVGLLACKTQVPVIPARIFGSFEAYGKGVKIPRFGTPVSVVFGAALPPAAYDDPASGKERYQIASERIMRAVAALELPRPVVV